MSSTLMTCSPESSPSAPDLKQLLVLVDVERDVIARMVLNLLTDADRPVTLPDRTV